MNFNNRTMLITVLLSGSTSKKPSWPPEPPRRLKPPLAAKTYKETNETSRPKDTKVGHVGFEKGSRGVRRVESGLTIQEIIYHR